MDTTFVDGLFSLRMQCDLLKIIFGKEAAAIVLEAYDENIRCATAPLKQTAQTAMKLHLSVHETTIDVGYVKDAVPCLKHLKHNKFAVATCKELKRLGDRCSYSKFLYLSSLKSATFLMNSGGEEGFYDQIDTFSAVGTTYLKITLSLCGTLLFR